MTDQPLQATARLVEAVRQIELSIRRIAVVVDAEKRLIGTLTDGDIRRCLLTGGTLDTPVSQAMNTTPITATVGSSEGHLLHLMRAGNIRTIPLVDEGHRLIKLVHLRDLSPGDQGDLASGFACAVIMAGGEGTRLRPLTENIPKPMVDICGVPLLERQIGRLAKAGISRIYLSVNYLSHIIEEHFGDGEAFGVQIFYLKEKVKLGTGGALSLLPEQPDHAILVMNGDILTNSNFSNLFAFHQQHSAEVTVAAVDYHIEIPFGVIQSEGPYVRQLLEKPSQRFLCNAGIYAVSPQALDLIPQNTLFNMTDLVNLCLEQQRPVAVFPLHEYWSDIGTPADLDQARSLFLEKNL